MKNILWFVLAVLMIGVVGSLGALAYRAWCQAQTSAATRIDTPNGIETLEEVALNDSKQWLYIRGQDRNNPVLLFLHGGPGMTEMPVARLFGLELEKYYTVVHWDQRAAGKSRVSEPDVSGLTIELYLEDTLSLVNLLRERFDQKKIYLIGHSWGSILGVLTVRDHPELFHAYIGMGQTISIKAGEQHAYDFVMSRALEENNEEALNELKHIRPPYDADFSELFIHRKWLNWYGGAISDDVDREALVAYLTSPEYTLLDAINMESRGFEITEHLWPEMTQIDFLRQAPKLDVPVFFFVGRNDHQTPQVLVEAYFDVLQAPMKKLFWFENSAHAPNFAEPELFQALLINEVLGADKQSAND